MNQSSELQIQGVTVALGHRTLFGPVDAMIGPGECLTVMGPSGCGKSTLLAFLAGTLDPVFRARGRVRLGASDLTQLPPERRHIGILFQDDLLFPHLSVGANLAFALPGSVLPLAARRARIAQALVAHRPGAGGRRPRRLRRSRSGHAFGRAAFSRGGDAHALG